jgi:hypothetical protein
MICAQTHGTRPRQVGKCRWRRGASHKQPGSTHLGKGPMHVVQHRLRVRGTLGGHGGAA